MRSTIPFKYHSIIYFQSKSKINFELIIYNFLKIIISFYNFFQSKSMVYFEWDRRMGSSTPFVPIELIIYFYDIFI